MVDHYCFSLVTNWLARSLLGKSWQRVCDGLLILVGPREPMHLSEGEGAFLIRHEQGKELD